MEDRAIVAIGKLRYQKLKQQNFHLVDFYIENMFPGRDYKMIVVIFEENNQKYSYNKVDIENVSSTTTDYLKYAYRKGTSRGGDITFTTKIGKDFDKKLDAIQNQVFKNFETTNNKYSSEVESFRKIKEIFIEKKKDIREGIKEIVSQSNEKESLGLTFKFIVNGKEKYLRDFDLVKDVIITKSLESYYTHDGDVSKAQEKVCSISGKKEKEVYGFASPFKYYTPDKPGFISGFFHKKKNWRNYPISQDQTLYFELGERYIREHLNTYFYGYEYILVPRTINPLDTANLEKIIDILKKAILEEKNSHDLKARYEDRLQKVIAQQENFFYIDILFFDEDKTTGAMKINIMLEEILPSRFRTLFVDTPAKIKEKYTNENIEFNFGIVKEFFGEKFLDVVQKIFLAKKISKEFVFQSLMNVYRANYLNIVNSKKHQNPQTLVVKAFMLIDYLTLLRILEFNPKNTNMHTENIKTDKTFQQEVFKEFVTQNKHFFDSEIKIGIFAVGVLVRFLLDIQQSSLRNTPFENKFRGYKLNADLLMQIYTEALDKIQKYQKNFYVYGDLREIINEYFTLKYNDITQLSNNEISFYFVAGLEMGRRFKNKENQAEE